jgi:predicted RNA-binding Zn ribbon-like protein
VEPVALDPGDYTGTYKLVGGRVALDFVNTVSWPGSDRGHDWLDRPANAVRWAVAAELVMADDGTAERLATRHERHPVEAARSLGRLHELRADMTAVLRPLAHGERPPAATVERLNAHLGRLCARRRIDPDVLDWTWGPVDKLDDLHGRLVADAAAIVTQADHSRLGHCPSCDWLFFDTTRNRSRRWCDMNDCGSRDKALRYYHRRRG